MNKVRAHISVSLDGYVAGPNQSMENPLGEGGEGLHDWVVPLKAWREHAGMEGGEENVSSPVVTEEFGNVGAEIMGRGKFGPPSRGPWGMPSARASSSPRTIGGRRPSARSANAGPRSRSLRP